MNAEKFSNFFATDKPFTIIAEDGKAIRARICLKSSFSVGNLKDEQIVNAFLTIAMSSVEELVSEYAKLPKNE
jgi:hypothetical protein